MSCLKAEALRREIYSSSNGVILPVNLGSSLQKAMHSKGGRKAPFFSSSQSVDESASSSGFEDVRSIDDMKSERVGCYRFQLEKEVQILQKQLQEEIDLHVALASAVADNTEPIINSPSKVPDKAQELLANIAELEITVSKLEKELSALHLRLSQERNERHLAETHLKYIPALPLEPPTFSSGFMWEKQTSFLRDAKFGRSSLASSPQLDLSKPNAVDKIFERFPTEELTGPWSMSKQKKEVVASCQQYDVMSLKKKNLTLKNLLNHPNKLSEEMLRCMRDIYLCLSDSSSAPPRGSSSDILPSSSSPVGHLSQSSSRSFSDSSMATSSTCTPSVESNHNCQRLSVESSFDPYRVNGKTNWKNSGSYSLADEVSWMSVGKEQLEYAAEALKKFRFLVEQLAKVNPAHMLNNEKLAFWINLYNALMLHAYLAYGIPRSDIKLFALMQKVSYTVGGQSFSAAEIEFVILKMKPPAHRPQIALVLAINKFKVSDEYNAYSIDKPEPLIVFALSSGMYSSPAVRIFTAHNVLDELQQSMRDYIQASIGISDKGKLLIPKLLHCFARNVVEDSLLVDWICRYLTPDQVTIVRDSTSQKKQRLLGVRSFNTIPFDSRFRYLFLPDNNKSSLDSC